VPLCPEDCRLGHQPPMWYRPSWPQMKAFALPSYSEGYVRINLRGREAAGIVAPEDYGRVCDEIEGLLGRVRDARTGQPMVANIMRSRTSAVDTDPNLPDADLLVQWTARPVDVVDTPCGRIGPCSSSTAAATLNEGSCSPRGLAFQRRRLARRVTRWISPDRERPISAGVYSWCGRKDSNLHGLLPPAPQADTGDFTSYASIRRVSRGRRRSLLRWFGYLFRQLCLVTFTVKRLDNI
jgi:hypothetical protein